ncbi:MAG: thioredoxin [Bacteroidaceae bacterium]|jgi:thioredoxin 1|nr:thioredoxin [Bacteroidaceae bacterium]MBP5690505.1 thioredoxin [Bacteroidaceae bacterium]MBR5159599.1 thioredoxin [Bacteroidaceae bacterium]
MELEITSQNFDEIKQQGKPVLVDFWATWCGPCKRLGPIIEELAAEYDGKAIIGKCDIEENDELTEQFGIMNVPTVVFLKDGKEVDRVVGLAMKNVYQDKLNALL